MTQPRARYAIRGCSLFVNGERMPVSKEAVAAALGERGRAGDPADAPSLPESVARLILAYERQRAVTGLARALAGVK